MNLESLKQMSADWFYSLSDGLSFAEWRVKRAFNAKRRANFFKDMESFVRVGIPPSQAIEDMLEVSRPRRQMRWLVNILLPIKTDAAAGLKLSQALNKWLPPEEAAVIAAGEASGDLRSALEHLQKLVQNKVEMRAAFVKSFAPAVLMVLVVIGVMLVQFHTLISFVQEEITPADMEKTVVAKYFIGVGYFFNKWLIYLTPVMIIGGIWVTWSLSNWRPGGIRTRLDRRIFPWSLYARQQATFFTIACAAMLKANMQFKHAVQEIQESAGPWTATHLRRMLNKLAAGAKPVQAMTGNLLPWDVEDRISIYAKLPNLHEVMNESANSSLNMMLNKVKLVGKIAAAVAMMLLVVLALSSMASMNEITGLMEAAAKREGVH